MKSVKDRIVGTDWASLALDQRIRHFKIEGYVVIPDLLGPDQVNQLQLELESLPTQTIDYTDKKHYHNDLKGYRGALTELIGHKPTIDFLRLLFGDDPIMMTYDYARSDPGCPAISLHCDGQPWGSKVFGAEHSCPKLVRVLYYLQNLTPKAVPFRIVPRSHLSFHNDANPYLRYKEYPEQAIVLCGAGSAVLINQNVFHGNYPNRSNDVRQMLGIAYRPFWSGSCQEVETYQQIAGLSPEVRVVMRDRNTRIWLYEGGNVPPNMPSKASGINPSRWELT